MDELRKQIIKRKEVLKSVAATAEDTDRVRKLLQLHYYTNSSLLAHNEAPEYQDLQSSNEHQQEWGSF